MIIPFVVMVDSIFRGLLFAFLWREGEFYFGPCERLALHLLRFGGLNVAFPKLPAALTNVDRYRIKPEITESG